MGKIGAGLIAVMVFVLAIGTYYWANMKRVEAGYVGIKVDLLGSAKGVSSVEVGPGRYFIGINEDLYIFPTFAVNYVWTKDPAEGSKNDESVTFQSIEGMNVSADIGITYSVDPKMVSDLFQRYRKGINEITDVYLRNAVRDSLVSSASQMKIRQIYGQGKNDLMASVESRVRTQVSKYGINIERIYWIGGLRLPKSVVQSVNDEIAATAKSRQRQNEVEAAKAEANKARAKAQGKADAILSVATAQAQANSLLAQSLNQTIIDYETVKRWDGKLPVYTGAGTPLINISK